MKIIGASCILFTALAFSCSAPPPAPQKPVIDEAKIKEPLMDINKQINKEENLAIDAYVKRRNYTMNETGTGVRWMVYQKGNGPTPRSKETVLINFEVSLLDGTICYSSKQTGAEEFVVDYDLVESGLHEAIKYLHQGDKAIIIIPPHKAFGLAGDNDKIPPLSTVVYNLELLKINP